MNIRTRDCSGAALWLEDPRPFERPGKEPLAPIPEPEPHLPSPELPDDAHVGSMANPIEYRVQ